MVGMAGKGQSTIDAQWVRRTTLTVPTPFPCACLRQLVVDSESVETAPIANAIEIVRRRGRQLRKVLSRYDSKVTLKLLTNINGWRICTLRQVAKLDRRVFSDSVQLGENAGPNRNMLEQALCGSLLLQVNGGALEVGTPLYQSVSVSVSVSVILQSF